ncbi:AmmeMemoRadiSam system radical SAM enzyme [Sporomusa termitida]|uniref:AmmeMemoRadiSam system radical SAM enzyme n=1 Tax=Sporomusa termitida TaxID=2377 RepID=A0A517DNM6_9FIRM|nr:AmmeMemoRadiSam system radical SAM enzyme [Sporomusa termitida]QDR78856.1 AmmeMemoRadiSam system radical SAM enzyme [Sporomusa termitida]
MREALYYRQDDKGIACSLCPQGCILSEGQTGLCRVRQNTGGTLYSLNYGQATAQALDPIEKKPLYHFYPGSRILSLGSWGCNFACRFCQNWPIAHGSPPVTSLLPAAAAALAGRLTGRGNIGVAYTYSEPSVWYEYILDAAGLVQAAGLKNVLVTNGFINPQPLQQLLPYIAAMNIDVKAFNNQFYQQICAGQLEQVKQTVELAARHCHVEVTTLIVPGLNDSAAEISALAEWLAGISPDIPLHLSRYFPNYKLDIPPTPVSTLAQACNIARQALNYVYPGNAGSEGLATYCPGCGCQVIDRLQALSRLNEKNCPRCGRSIPITGEVRF